MRVYKWLSQLLFSLVLLLTWLLLHNSLAPGHIALGTVLAIIIPLFTAPFSSVQTPIRSPLILLVFLKRLFLDLLIANVNVARLVLSPTPTLRPGFVELPLTLKNEFAIAVLANTISLTPGTVSADLSPDRSRLLIHCLDVEDEMILLEQIKNRYETLLRKVFEPC
jgi:multicomponent K+:H+ antiporter subunit E